MCSNVSSGTMLNKSYVRPNDIAFYKTWGGGMPVRPTYSICVQSRGLGGGTKRNFWCFTIASSLTLRLHACTAVSLMRDLRSLMNF